MKNYQTPRTLSECQFDVGYPIFVETEKLTNAGIAYVVALVAAVAAFIWIAL